MSAAAIISDIHANLEALEAVLSDIDARGIRTIICLGDIVGYGPDPIECVDLIRKRCTIAIRGNHDEALVKGAWGFNHLARDAIEYHRRVMKPRFFRPGSKARWEFIENLPLRGEWEGALLVHGSPRDPISEYVLPHEVSWPPPGKFEEIFESFERVCFVGHTHVPGVFSEGPVFLPAAELPETFGYDGEKMLINVGSVGQPRDGDWRACYLSVDGDRYSYHRVEYDLDATRQKFDSIPDLDDRLGDRLRDGE